LGELLPTGPIMFVILFLPAGVGHFTTLSYTITGPLC
jgi:hypothetical protein